MKQWIILVVMLLVITSVGAYESEECRKSRENATSEFYVWSESCVQDFATTLSIVCNDLITQDCMDKYLESLDPKGTAEEAYESSKDVNHNFELMNETPPDSIKVKTTENGKTVEKEHIPKNKEMEKMTGVGVQEVTSLWDKIVIFINGLFKDTNWTRS